MTPADLRELADRCERAKVGKKLRFSLFAGQGWVAGSSEETIRTLCDLWNNRTDVAAALRARADHLQSEGNS